MALDFDPEDLLVGGEGGIQTSLLLKRDTMFIHIIHDCCQTVVDLLL